MSSEALFDAFCASDAKARFEAQRALSKGDDRQRSYSASRVNLRTYSRVRVDPGRSRANFLPHPTADVNKQHRSKSADHTSNARSVSFGTPIVFPDEDDGSMTEAEREKTTSRSGLELFSFSPISPPRPRKRVLRGSGPTVNSKITSRSKSARSTYGFDSESDSDAPLTTLPKRPGQKRGAVGSEFERAAANKSTSADRLRKTVLRTEPDYTEQEFANIIVDLSSDDDTPSPLCKTQAKPQCSKLAANSRVKSSSVSVALKVKPQQVTTESRDDSHRLNAGGGSSKQTPTSCRAMFGKPAHVKPKPKADASRKLVKGRVRLIGKNQERPTVRFALLDNVSGSPFGRRSLQKAKSQDLEKEMDDEAESGECENDANNNPTKKASMLIPVPASRNTPVPNEVTQKRRRVLSSTDQQAHVPGVAEAERSSQEERREELLMDMSIEANDLQPEGNNEFLAPHASTAFNSQPLHGCVLSFSQYAEQEKNSLADLATRMGAVVQEHFACTFRENLHLPNTHLLLSKPEGLKFQAALKWRIPAVNIGWLLDTLKLGVRQSEALYKVGVEPSSVDAVDSNERLPLADDEAPQANRAEINAQPCNANGFAAAQSITPLNNRVRVTTRGFRAASKQPSSQDAPGSDLSDNPPDSDLSDNPPAAKRSRRQANDEGAEDQQHDKVFAQDTPRSSGRRGALGARAAAGGGSQKGGGRGGVQRKSARANDNSKRFHIDATKNRNLKVAAPTSVAQRRGKSVALKNISGSEDIKVPKRGPPPQVFQCKIGKCRKICKDGNELRIHVRRHTGEKPFPCKWPHCHQRFVTPDELKQHMNGVHLNIRPFKCAVCELAFKKKWHLVDHLRAKHKG